MNDDWMRPMSASLRRRARRRRVLRIMLPVISPYTDRLKRAAWGDHVCQPFIVRPGPPPTVLLLPADDPLAGVPDLHVCPDCHVERADWEGRPGWHLPKCPNCGSGADPIPAAVQS